MKCSADYFQEKLDRPQSTLNFAIHRP